MVAGSALPLLIAAGVGIDIARLAMAQVALQAAVDGAALAGATVYSNAGASATAQSVGRTYFDHYTQGATVINMSRTASTQQGTLANGQTAFRVSIAATAQMPTAFMGVAGFATMTVTAHAVAANPYLQPNPSPAPGGSVAIGKTTTDASDWNTVYMYPVPMDANGTVHFDQLPPQNQFFEIANNCRSIDVGWGASSPCNGRYGADWTQPTGTPPIYAPNQPIGFILVNQNGGVSPHGSSNGVPNKSAYGTIDNTFAVFGTAPFALNQSPSAYADSGTAIYIVNAIFPSNKQQTQPSGVSTTFSQVTKNCSLIIQAWDTTTTLPSGPPTGGRCFQLNDPVSGSQYATLSCSQMNGRTFIYWWNDMGGQTDDYDYNDISYQFSCNPAPTGSGNSSSASATPSVSLVQ